MGMADDDKFHVLAVDDSLIDRKVIERLLKTSSFQVTTVDSGSKALEFLGWQHQHDSNETSSSVSPIIPPQQVQVNLVITDYCMPGMTGYDLLKKMKESSLLKDIPVVIMSSENVPSRITRCLEEGAEEFFLKPVRSSDVNKLRPYIIKTKIKKQDIEKPEKQEIIIESEEIDEYQKKAAAESLQQQEQNNNTKRKSMDEGLSPDRTRPRYTSTVMSN